MKFSLMLALAALALSFALSGCASSAKKATTEPAASANESVENVGDPEEHRKTVMAHVEEFRTCYKPALQRHPGLTGVITLRWDVDSAGDVVREDVITDNTTIPDRIMIACMLEKVHNWKFDTGRKGEVSTVTYPFYFNPPERR